MITVKSIRSMLKLLNFNKYHTNAAFIRSYLTGIEVPHFSSDDISRITVYYNRVIGIFS